MSLVTAIPYNNQDESHVTCHGNNDNTDNEQEEQQTHDVVKSILFLGFVTGLFLETCDLGIGVATKTSNNMELWQQVLFSLGWSCMVTLVVYIIMVCIQYISNNFTENFQANFLVGAVSGLATAIALNLVMKGSWWFVAIVTVPVLVIATVVKFVVTTESERKDCSDEKIARLAIV